MGDIKMYSSNNYGACQNAILSECHGLLEVIIELHFPYHNSVYYFAMNKELAE